MNEIPLWNRINLPAPATSAHKVDLSDASHLRDKIGGYLKKLEDKKSELEKIVNSMKAEIVVLKRFIYKIATIFAHDKTYKVLKQIYTAAGKLLRTDLLSDVEIFQGQHTYSSEYATARTMYVAPRPKYEFVLVRLQGNIALLAQILCLCQHYGSVLVQRIHLGHFINIFIICMSSTSRLWALSLHMMNLLIDLFESTSNIFRTEGCLPSSTLSFLTSDCTLPLNIVDWLRSNENLKGMHLLLDKQQSRVCSTKPEIWQSIKVDDEELDHLRELRDLVACSKPKEIPTCLDEFPLKSAHASVDIGELVSRESSTPKITKKQRKRANKSKVRRLQT